MGQSRFESLSQDCYRVKNGRKALAHTHGTNNDLLKIK